jgi:hypothetical protein
MITTLPLPSGERRAVSFDVLGVYEDRLFLRDLSEKWNGYATVIDAAEHVLQYCRATYGARRIICEGWNSREILDDNGKAVVVPYNGHVPLKVALAPGFPSD